MNSESRSAEKSYECEVCHQTFNDAACLSEHKQIYRSVKPYVCDVTVCNKAFTAASNLFQHKRDVCSKTFTQYGHLQVHKRIHTGDKPMSSV